MSEIHIEIEESKVKSLVIEYLQSCLGDVVINEDDVKIEVKSKNNYKAEWEVACFRAVVNITL